MVIDIVREGIFRRKFTFKFRDELIGTMEYKRFYSRQAIMTWGDQTWRASRRGIFRRKVHMEQDMGMHLEIDFGTKFGNEIKVNYEGADYLFHKNGVFKNKYSWLNSAERELMEFRKIRSKRAEIIMSLSFQDNQHAYWLAFLGWYFIVCQKEDQASAAAAVS